MKITNRLNLPQAIVEACTTEPHNAAGELSATTLLKGTKQILLEQRHWNELKNDVSDRIWAVWGTAVHKLLEDEGENEFTEETLKTEEGGITITGRIDNYNMQNGIVTDWKTASVWKVMYQDFDDWKRQGLIYAWLLARNNMPIDKCRFVALLKDHSAAQARIKADYPQSPVYVYEYYVTVHDIDEIEDWIESVVADYMIAYNKKDDEIPPCRPDQRWATDSKWALMKKGRKSAVKLFSDESEAVEACNASGKGFSVVERRGEDKRCENYCIVAPYCNYWREHYSI